MNLLITDFVFFLLQSHELSPIASAAISFQARTLIWTIVPQRLIETVVLITAIRVLLHITQNNQQKISCDMSHYLKKNTFESKIQFSSLEIILKGFKYQKWKLHFSQSKIVKIDNCYSSAQIIKTLLRQKLDCHYLLLVLLSYRKLGIYSQIKKVWINMVYISSGFSQSEPDRRFNNRHGICRLREGSSIDFIQFWVAKEL